MTRNVIGIPNSSPVLAYCPAQSRTSAFCHMNQCLPQGGLSSSNTCLLHLVRPMATCDGYSPELIWQETEAERSCVPQGHTARLQVAGRGSSWVPVEVWSAAGAFHLFINRSQSGDHRSLRSEKIHRSERSHLPGLEAGPLHFNS